MAKYKTIHLSLDEETSQIVKEIPEKFKSRVLRNLLQAYKEFAGKGKNSSAPYVVMAGDIKLIQQAKER